VLLGWCKWEWPALFGYTGLQLGVSLGSLLAFGEEEEDLLVFEEMKMAGDEA